MLKYPSFSRIIQKIGFLVEIAQVLLDAVSSVTNFLGVFKVFGIDQFQGTLNRKQALEIESDHFP